VVVGGNAATFPPGNFFPASLAGVGFTDLAAGNYALAAGGPYVRAGTDGKDVGVDFAALNAAMSSGGGPPPPPPPPPSAPPNVWMTAPAVGATLAGTVTVSAGATSSVGVAGVQFKLDGANLGVEVTAAPYALSWDTTTAPAGSHSLTAVARDSAGHTATSATMSVTVANGTGGGGGGGSLTWASLTKVTATGGSLQKTAGCDGCNDAGAVSLQQIATGNGYAEFTATDGTTLRSAGLTHAFTVSNPGSIDFAIRLQAGIAEVRENGVFRTDTRFAAGDVFRIAVALGVVRYSRNGVVFYTSTMRPTYPLFFAAALANLSATIGGATITGSSFAFTDGIGSASIIPARSVVIKAIHVLELRSAIRSLRSAVGLAAFDWTDPALVPGVTPVRSVHLTELRTALSQAYQRVGRTPPAFSDLRPGPGLTVIRAVHLNELRSAALGLQ